MSYFFRQFFAVWNPFVDRVPSHPIKRLADVAYRASRIVNDIPLKELQDVGGLLGEAIDNEKELYVEAETEDVIESLLRRGGGEARKFFSDPDEITRASLRRLITEHADDVEELGLPDEDDLRDLHALRDALDYERLISPFLDPFSGAPHLEKVYAVLCLMKVEECLIGLEWKKGRHNLVIFDGLGALTMSIAADVAIEAVESLASAELEAAIAKERHIAQRNLEAVSLEKLLKADRQERVARADATRQQARADGNASRARQFSDMAEFTRQAWSAEKVKYAMPDGRFDRERFAVELIPRLGERFRRKSTTKGGKKGDPLTPKFDAVLRWMSDPD